MQTQLASVSSLSLVHSICLVPVSFVSVVTDLVSIVTDYFNLFLV